MKTCQPVEVCFLACLESENKHKHAQNNKRDVSYQGTGPSALRRERKVRTCQPVEVCFLACLESENKHKQQNEQKQMYLCL